MPCHLNSSLRLGLHANKVHRTCYEPGPSHRAGWILGPFFDSSTARSIAFSIAYEILEWGPLWVGGLNDTPSRLVGMAIITNLTRANGSLIKDKVYRSHLPKSPVYFWFRGRGCQLTSAWGATVKSANGCVLCLGSTWHHVGFFTD